MDSWPYSREPSRSVAFRNNTVAPSGRQKGGVERGELLSRGSQPQALGAGPAQAGEDMGSPGDQPSGGREPAAGATWVVRVGLRSLGCAGTRLYGREGLEPGVDGPSFPLPLLAQPQRAHPCLAPTPPWLVTILNTL